MVHFPLLSAVCRAMMITMIIMLIPYLLGFTSIFAYLASFILLTVFDPVLFGQVYLWSSGFYNYIPPVWMALLAITIIRNYSSCVSLFSKTLACLTLVLLGFCSQLYVEHSTIINLILAFSLLVYTVATKKYAHVLPCLLWFIATLMGTITMFSIPILFAPEGNRSEGYRSYNLGALSTLIVSCVKNGMWLTNYYSGVNSLPLCLGAVSTLYLTRHQRNNKKNRFLFISSLICGGILFFSDFVSVNGWYGEPALFQHAFFTILVLTEFVIWVLAATRLSETRTRNITLFLLFLAFMSLAPLLIVSPVHMRVAFQSYLFFCAAAMLCLSKIQWKKFQMFQYRTSAALIIIACIVFTLGSTMLSVKIMSELREAYILQKIEQGATEITISNFPFDYTQWDGTWSFGCYFFREEKEDIAFRTIGYNEWKCYYLPELFDSFFNKFSPKGVSS